MITFEYMGDTYSRETEWTSCHNKRQKIVDIDTNHLINIFYFLLKRSIKYPNMFPDFDKNMAVIVGEVLTERGVDLQELDGEEIPHLDPNGKLVKWNWSKGRPVEVQNG